MATGDGAPLAVSPGGVTDPRSCLVRRWAGANVLSRGRPPTSAGLGASGAASARSRLAAGILARQPCFDPAAGGGRDRHRSWMGHRRSVRGGDAGLPASPPPGSRTRPLHLLPPPPPPPPD